MPRRKSTRGEWLQHRSTAGAVISSTPLMLLAANLLSRSSAPLARIAEDVGYQTDTAFSRAFRREYGAPPAAWRKSQSTREHVR